MATRTVPLLPCASIDEIVEFYTSFGFRVAYRQRTPNPYVAVELDDLSLHYFGIEGFVPEDSYGSCLVLVDDTEPLFRIFEKGLKARYGKLPLTGYPRITRPRARRNAGGLSGFSLIDPSGNWIRVMRDEPSRGAVVNANVDGGRLAQALANAVVLADSHGTVVRPSRSSTARSPANGPRPRRRNEWMRSRSSPNCTCERGTSASHGSALTNLTR